MGRKQLVVLSWGAGARETKLVMSESRGLERQGKVLSLYRHVCDLLLMTSGLSCRGRA